MARSRSSSSASSALPYFNEQEADAAAADVSKSRMPPPILVPIPPSRSASPPPQSPAVVLSPSTPDFPECPLPYDAITTVTELIPAQYLPARRAATDPLPQNGFPSHSAFGHEPEETEQGRFRDSILRLNQKVAEIERIEALHVEASGAFEAGLAETSVTSLASIASGASSEDAFDIADFPSLAQLDSSFNLLELATSSHKREGSDRVAFPLPPSLPDGAPLQQSSPPPSIKQEHDVEDEHARRFAELEEHQKHSLSFGLGLFTAAPESAPVMASSPDTSSSRDSTISGRSSLSSKSFDASTLESSAANTSYSAATLHKEAFEQAFPAELSSTIPWFAQSPPVTSARTLPDPIDALAIDIGSAHPALASPFVTASPTVDAVGSPAPEQTSERAESGDGRSESSGTKRAVDGLTDALDQTGVADWVTGRSPASLFNEDIVAQRTEGVPEPPVPTVMPETARAPRTAPVIFVRADEATPPPKTVRRFSSLGLLKKRKSEAALRPTNAKAEAPAAPKVPGLLKRKSDAALNSILRASRGRNHDKENSPAPANANCRRPVISAPLQPDEVSAMSPRRAVKRSVSTPKLSRLFASTNSKVPEMPSSIRAPAGAARGPPRTDSLQAGATGTPTMKKRISMYFDRLGSASPPAPQPAKLASPAQQRAPPGMTIDVEKANEARPLSRIVSERESNASTLEITSPTETAPTTTLFTAALPSTATTPPATSEPYGSISSMAAVVHAALNEKPDPSAESATPFSAPPGQTNFVFPGGSRPTALRPMSVQEEGFDKRDSGRMSVSGFFRSDAPSSTGRPDGGQAADVFPTTSKRSAPIEAGRDADSQRLTDSPDSGALLDHFPLSSSLVGLDLAHQQLFAPVPPATTIAFPAVAMTAPVGGAGGDPGDSDTDSEDDDYGSRTGSSADGAQENDDDDRPLGVVAPGALKAQKSLRLSAAKSIRSKARAAAGQVKGAKGAERARRREDPFELEGAAAMVNTPPRSRDGHGDGSEHRSDKRLVPLDTSAKARSGSLGHDSLLPQSDASISRRTVPAGASKSALSSPLDPLVADSALIMDSPEPLHQALPALPSRTPSTTSTNIGRKTSKDSTGSSRSPMMFHAPSALDSTAAHPPARPPLMQRGSSLSSAGTAVPVPGLHRQPSLHPDQHGPAARRHASTSSAHSSQSQSQRPAPVQRTRSTASSTAPHTTEHRIYLDAGLKEFLTIPISDRTLAGDVVALAKARGALASSGPSDGGWALWETWKTLGYERPLREYELVHDVTRSWDVGSNALFFRRTTMWPILSTHAHEKDVPAKTGSVQIETKDGKWNKRYLRLDAGVLKQCKSERFKDATVLCQLAQFDVFLVSAETANRHRAPKPYVFALKSRLPRAHFEDSAQWCHLVSTKTPEEAASWVKTIIEAGNPYARHREKAVLGSSPVSPLSSPLLSSPLLSGLSISTEQARASPPALLSPTFPNASSAAAPRQPSRPAPASLAVRSHTISHPSSPAMTPSSSGQGSTLSRHNTVTKPDSRQWSAMDEEKRQEWLRASERAAKQSKTPLVDLSR
ncbi:hypothetical protein JCM8202v2_000531 [Rhodotorula sphaerocarpa]